MNHDTATARWDEDAVLTAADKGIPERAIGMRVGAFLATQPHLSEFWTPLLVLDDSAMRHNVDTLQRWTAERGIDLMPHGKTTMAPALWKRQTDAGAYGITLATMGQVRTARAAGVASIQLANAPIDPRSLRWLSAELADPDFRFLCWADSEATVALMEAGLPSDGPRVDVLVELGADGGRTGARTIAEAIRVAERIAASPVLRLAGVAGYEGSLAHGGRTSAELEAVRTYLRSQIELHTALATMYEPDSDVVVTAGGSAYFDLVAAAWAEAGASADAAARRGDGRTRWIMRSGAYIVHDDGFYRQVSPFDEARSDDDAPRFMTAMHGLARVVSRPEERLALLDGGKRDLPHDEGLPIPRAIGPDLGGPWEALAGAEVSALNDQHAYLRSTAGAAPQLGNVVRLGLSHPCTAFDKWRVIPVVDSLDAANVIELVRTLF